MQLNFFVPRTTIFPSLLKRRTSALECCLTFEREVEGGKSQSHELLPISYVSGMWGVGPFSVRCAMSVDVKTCGQ